MKKPCKTLKKGVDKKEEGIATLDKSLEENLSPKEKANILQEKKQLSNGILAAAKEIENLKVKKRGKVRCIKKQL